MSLILSSIVGGVNEKNGIVNSVQANDWTAKRAIIASNEKTVKFLSSWILVK